MEHPPFYLQQELYTLIQKDEKIIEFLDTYSLDGIWFWDLENPEMEWMSPRFWKVLGYNPEEMPHSPSAWQTIIFEEDLALAIENFNKHCADSSHQYDQIVRYRHKHGHTVWIRCRGVAIRNDKGEPIRMLGVHNDFTNLKQNSQWLEIFTYAPFSLLKVSSEGIIELVNSVSESLFGYASGELVGENIETLVPNEFRSNHPKYRQKYLVEGAPMRAMSSTSILYAQRKDGTRFPCEIGLSGVLNEESQSTMVYVVDITERYLAKQKLERKSKEMEQFAYAASHDLKEPIKTLQAFSNYLIEDVKIGNEKRVQQDIDFINASCNKLTRLIESLLSLSKMSEVKYRDCNLEEIVTTCLSMLKNLIDISHPVIVTDIDVPLFMADESQVQVMIQNLIHNAVKFSAKSPTPEIKIHARLYEHSEIIIQITDNGVGIPKNKLADIFGIFKQCHGDNDYEGTGIGLALVNKVVEQHQGSISVTSSLKKGTCFTICLPFTSPP